MKKTTMLIALLAGTACLLPNAEAKLPPLSAEAQAKADEAKAKAAWSDKVAAFQLCKAQDKVAAQYLKGKSSANVVSTPACADPGAFVYPLPAEPQKPAAAH